MLSQLKLGALPFQPNPKDLHFQAYLAPRADQLIEAAMAPGAINWHKVPTATGVLPTPNRDPLHNDVHGNCVRAGMANGAMLVSQMVGQPRIITGEEVDASYADGTDFDPVTGANDDGEYPVDALTDWTRKDIYGTRCRAHCLVDANNPEEVLLAMFLGGWLLGAYDLPLSAQNQVDAAGNPDWRVDPTRTAAENERRGWGGHAFCEHAANMPQNTTWGLHGHFTDNWRRAYVSSLHLVLLRDWRLANGRAPNGFDFEQLLSDARARGAVG
jgi:hypothetical protein